jgi:type IV pilus assembly protein PilM
MMLFSKKKLLGLDIGTSSIKAALVDSKRRGYVLKKFSMHETPHNSISSGEVLDPISLAGALSDVGLSMRMKKKLACVSLWGSGIIVKKVSIPRMEKDLIKEQIQWEAEQYIPFDISEINLEYHLLPGYEYKETMEILLVAAKKDFVGKLVDVVDNSGMQVNVMDVSGFALANCFEANYGRLSGETVALLNIGAGVTNFVVVESGEVIFCRDLPTGGLVYTNEIQRQMGVSYAEAETLKISASGGKDVPIDLQTILSNVNATVIDEIAGGVDFFAATGAGNSIGRIFITGGSASVPDLVEGIAKTFRLPCESFDPFLNITWERSISREYIEQIRPFAAVAMGLAMRVEEKK